MSLSMYQVAIPGVVQILEGLSKILDKAIANCAARKIDQAILVNFRLAPDMFPFSRQIQIATDGVKGMAARLSGQEVPSYADNEATLDDLKARVAKTLAFVKSVSAAQLEGSETKDIALKVGPNEMKFKGLDYLTGFVLPNFYFHVTAAYAILRHCGVDVGKMDYLGQLPLAK